MANNSRNGRDTITKKEFIRLLSEYNGLTSKVNTEVFDAMCEVLRMCFLSGNSVKFGLLGSFELREVFASPSHKNFKTEESVDTVLENYNKVVFRPYNNLKYELKEETQGRPYQCVNSRVEDNGYEEERP